MGAPFVAGSSIPVVRQLHKWAEKNGVLLFPRSYPFTTITGTLSTVTKSLQPDGAFVCVALVGLSFDEPANQVSVDQIFSGGRKLVDGTLRLTSYQQLLETDGMLAQYLPAPIGVLPGDQLAYALTCEVAGHTFQNATGNSYETSAVGYAFHDVTTGAQLPDQVGRKFMNKLLDDLGEFHVLGLSGAALSIDASASPNVAMTCEVIAAQNLAPATVTAARLTLGLFEVVPPGLTLSQPLLAFRAPGLVLGKGTQCRMRTTAPGAVRASVAIAGRRMGN